MSEIQWLKPEAEQRMRCAAQNKPFVRAQLETELQRAQSQQILLRQENTGIKKEFKVQWALSQKLGCGEGKWRNHAQIKDKQWSLTVGGATYHYKMKS